MGKDFLKSKTDQKRLQRMLLGAGMILTISLGIRSVQNTELENAYELPKAGQFGESYEQELIACVGDQKIPLDVSVKERTLSEEEAEAELSKAEALLPELLKGGNETLSAVTTDLVFPDRVLDTFVEIIWTDLPTDYFYSDGKLREDYELYEAVELKLTAVLSCQEYTRDFEITVTLLPRISGEAENLQRLITMENEENPQNEKLLLPREYQGDSIVWKKPLDCTFVFLFILIVGAMLMLRIGRKRDEEQEKKERLEGFEKDYAQIVSKFNMLLSAGLSVRNAWERIVILYYRRQKEGHEVYRELSWGMKEMQKGVSELEVYEKVGIRIGQIHYKKLMALFLSDKRRGSIPLADAMNQEMLLALEEQKRKQKQQGEKIGTKLLLPMMGMLSVVFVMILVPAFMSFGL